jgi:hypothetical protein
VIFTAEHSLQDLASWLLRRVGLVHEPPVAVRRLADRLGVQEIRRTESGPTGRVLIQDERIVIELRRDVPRQRFRHTLAHELAHIVIADVSISLGAMRRERRLEDDERFCEELAAALLMPAWWIRRRFIGREQTLSVLSECAEQARSSLSSTLIGLSRHAAWNRSLLHWRLDEAELRLWGTTMVDRDLCHRLRAGPDAVELLGESEGTRTVWLPLLYAGCELRVPAQISRRNSSCMALVDRRVLHLQARDADGSTGSRAEARPKDGPTVKPAGAQASPRRLR